MGRHSFRYFWDPSLVCRTLIDLQTFLLQLDGYVLWRLSRYESTRFSASIYTAPVDVFVPFEACSAALYTERTSVRKQRVYPSLVMRTLFVTEMFYSEEIVFPVCNSSRFTRKSAYVTHTHTHTHTHTTCPDRIIFVTLNGSKHDARVTFHIFT
jgi:hypothetical protein